MDGLGLVISKDFEELLRWNLVGALGFFEFGGCCVGVTEIRGDGGSTFSFASSDPLTGFDPATGGFGCFRGYW